jgi:hypothetical protein
MAVPGVGHMCRSRLEVAGLEPMGRQRAVGHLVAEQSARLCVAQHLEHLWATRRD